MLEPGGRLVVVDLAAHGLERLREGNRHRRLGFSDEEIGRWFADLGLVQERAASAGRTRAHRGDLDRPAPARRRRRDDARSEGRRMMPGDEHDCGDAGAARP